MSEHLRLKSFEVTLKLANVLATVADGKCTCSLLTVESVDTAGRVTEIKVHLFVFDTFPSNH